MYFWTWNTREVLDLIEWMRAYNASGAGRMEFWGFDLQTPTVAMDSVRAFVGRADPAFLPAVDSAYEGVRAMLQERQQGRTPPPDALARWYDGASRVRQYLEANQRRYAAPGRDTMEVAWALQYARIVEQGALSQRNGSGILSRDSSMAVNVGWMLQHLPPSTKAVLWAHNFHVQRATGWMGGNLDAVYGPALRTVGFAFGDGDYTAMGPRGLTSYPAEPPPLGSVEAVLRATGLPRLALDLRAAKASPDGAWLAARHDFRGIGAVAQERAFVPTPVAERYDLLIYLDHTTPTQLLNSRQFDGARP
jgi:erythromycin esterase